MKKAVAELPKTRIPQSARSYYRLAGDNISPRYCSMYAYPGALLGAFMILGGSDGSTAA